jgi:hypothetical protein
MHEQAVFGSRWPLLDNLRSFREASFWGALCPLAVQESGLPEKGHGIAAVQLWPRIPRKLEVSETNFSYYTLPALRFAHTTVKNG